jgi:hypothetical protein
MLPTKDDEISKQTSGIGFVNSAHVSPKDVDNSRDVHVK